jgi:hypothetical protein
LQINDENDNNKNKYCSDDESTPFNDDDDTISTVSCSSLDNTSVGNASLETLKVYQLEADEMEINYRGPKILPKNETPATICTANTIGLLRSRKLLRVLLDSGSNACLIKRSALPKGIIPKDLTDKKSFTTLAGTLSAKQMVTLRDLRLPEFDKNRRITQQRALIFDSNTCKYDIILGTNFLSKTGIKLDYDEGNMVWYDCVLPMRPHCGLTSNDFNDMEDQYYIQVEEDLLGEDWLQSYATEILDAKYEFSDVTKVVNSQSHLDQNQKKDLLDILLKHQQLFDGTLGVYPHKKFHIDIEPNAKPVLQDHTLYIAYISVPSKKN